MKKTVDSLLSEPSGTVINEENEVRDAVVCNLELIAQGETTNLEKMVFYFQDQGNWQKVADNSVQTCELNATQDIQNSIEEESTVIEFGPGDFIKTREAFTTKIATYYAVDCNLKSLEDNISSLASEYPKTRVIGICTPFDRALSLFNQLGNDRKKTQIWSLGSTLSNYDADKVKQNLDKCRPFANTLWLGHDATSDQGSIELSYHNAHFDEFIQEGLKRAEKMYEEADVNVMTLRPFFTNTNWKRTCAFVSDPTKHTLQITATKGFGVVKKGTILSIFPCVKYSQEAFAGICEESSWTVVADFLANLTGSAPSSVVYLLRDSLQ